jgi:hypothetical protein
MTPSPRSSSIGAADDAIAVIDDAHHQRSCAARDVRFARG